MKIALTYLLKAICREFDAELAVLIRSEGESSETVAFAYADGSDKKQESILQLGLSLQSKREELIAELQKKGGYKKYGTFEIELAPIRYELLLFSNSEIPEKLESESWESIRDLLETKENHSGEFREALENVDVVVYSMKPKGFQINFISKAVEKLFGFSANEISKNKFTLLKKVQRESYSKVRKFLQEVSNGMQAVVEYTIADSAGKPRYIRHSGIPIKRNGKVISVVGAIVDVTEEVTLRERLQHSEEKFRLLMETAEDLIFTLDRQGNFLIVNKNGALMLGYTESEMIGKHFLEFVKEDNKADVALAFQKILASEDVVRFEAILVDIAGNEIVLEIQARSVRKNGEIDGVMAIGRDITERILQERELKDLNARLIEANRIISIERDRAQEKVTVLEELNRLKNEFISNVSHELRTPLASIVGFAEAITSDPEMPREMIDEFNNIIYTEGKRLAKLINDILDFSKLDAEGEKLEKKDFDFVPLLKELVEIYTKQAVEKGVELNAEIPETEIIIHGDRERLSNAIGHIISNAVKFTDKGGRVTVLVNNFLKDAEVIVSDTGIGIPKEELPKLFQKFSKINRPGSQVPGAGLGLAMAKKIIDLHNGLINVKSEVNKGTTFVIRLPKKI